MILRDYQDKAINQIREKLKAGHKRVLLALPTGAGKSHILGAIASRCIENGHKVLALMHRRQLVTQLSDMFKDCGVNSGIIMAGTDHSLENDCQIATMQTYNRRLKLCELEINKFYHNATVIMIDEAHHTLSKTYQTILGNYENKIVIGVTATPVLASGFGMGNYFDALVSPIGVGDLVKSGHLVPGVYYGPSNPDLTKVRTVMGDYHKGDLNKTMNQPQLVGDVVANWLKLGENRQTMVFAVKVSHSKALVAEFNKYGIPAEHLDAHHEDDERSDVLRRFRNGDTRVLSNVALYTEGTDIPEIGCIVLARPTKSLGFHLQMVGRGARPFDGKQNFIVLDHGGNIERLGYYEEEVEWSLDGKNLGFKKKPKPRQKKILTCKICAALFTGPVCPICGKRVEDYGKQIEAVDAELVRLKGSSKATMEEKRKWYSMFEYEKRRLGKSHSWILAQYKTKFGVWPVKMDNVWPIEPNQEVKNWLTSQRIRWIKRKQKEEKQKQTEKTGDLWTLTNSNQNVQAAG